MTAFNLTIAIDFDDTLTADPLLWAAFVRDAKSKGHRVLCITARRATGENAAELDEWFQQWDCSLPVIFASLGSKLRAVESRGIKVDIWIDDDPTKLVRGH